MQKVESSNIEAVGYNQSTEELFIEFKNGVTYKYEKVSFNVFIDLLDADSIGSFFYKHIRSDYAFTKL